MLPGLGSIALIAMFDAVVKVKVGSCAETFVIEAGKSEPFLEILFEGVKRFQLRSESGSGSATGTAPSHLIAAIDQ